MNKYSTKPIFTSKTVHNRWMSKSFNKNLVSIVIPTFNRVKFLQEALNSIWEQSYRPIEVLVVDDGSSDSTKFLVESWIREKNSSNFTVLYFYQSRCGAQVARNLGLIESTGEYIQFLDSDDTLLPEKLQWAVKILEDQEKDFVYFRTQVTDETLNPIPGRIYGKPYSDSSSDDIVSYLWHTSSPVYRRNVVVEVGPWLESLSGSQDWEYGARIKLIGYRAYFDARVGSLFRSHKTERIGVSCCNYEYTKSAELAYDHIFSIAQELAYTDQQFNDRLARLYLTRALEYNSLKYYADRNHCLGKVLSLQPSKDLVWLIAKTCSIFPNYFLVQIFNKILVMRRNLK